MSSSHGKPATDTGVSSDHVAYTTSLVTVTGEEFATVTGEDAAADSEPETAGSPTRSPSLAHAATSRRQRPRHNRTAVLIQGLLLVDRISAARGTAQSIRINTNHVKQLELPSFAVWISVSAVRSRQSDMEAPFVWRPEHVLDIHDATTAQHPSEIRQYAGNRVLNNARRPWSNPDQIRPVGQIFDGIQPVLCLDQA